MKCGYCGCDLWRVYSHPVWPEWIHVNCAHCGAYLGRIRSDALELFMNPPETEDVRRVVNPQ